MKKIIPIFVFAAALIFALAQCMNKSTPSVAKVAEAKVLTHKAAVDSLMVDSNAVRKPLIIKELNGRDGIAVLTQNDMSELLKQEYPANGFYGDDHYRIEFVVSEVKRDEADARLYHIKGKNRFKKTISPFTGTVRLKTISEMIDPNIDTTETGDLYFIKSYSVGGEFEIKEDSTLKSSGVFKGNMNMDFATKVDGTRELWFFSPESSAKGSGIKYEGTWTSYAKDKTKPVVWAADFFQFANTILKDFSMGEREVEINKEYRHLGWDNFWENDEWWVDAKDKQKEKM